MTVYGIQFWIECKGGSKTADELSDALDDLIYDGNLSLSYSNHSIIGAGLFMKNAVQNNFESIREILNEFADKIKYVSEWDYEDSSDVKWGVHTLDESRKSLKESLSFKESELKVDVKYTVSYSGKSPSVDREFSTDYQYDLYEFKEVCDSLSESQNGYYLIDENHSGSVDADYRIVFYTFDDSNDIDGTPTGEIQFNVILGYNKSIGNFFN